MTKLCPRGKAAAKRKFKVYPSAYANAYASKICAGKIKDPSGVKRKDFKGPKPAKEGTLATTKNSKRELTEFEKKRKKSQEAYSRRPRKNQQRNPSYTVGKGLETEITFTEINPFTDSVEFKRPYGSAPGKSYPIQETSAQRASDKRFKSFKDTVREVDKFKTSGVKQKDFKGPKPAALGTFIGPVVRGALGLGKKAIKKIAEKRAEKSFFKQLKKEGYESDPAKQTRKNKMSTIVGKARNQKKPELYDKSGAAVGPTYVGSAILAVKGKEFSDKISEDIAKAKRYKKPTTATFMRKSKKYQQKTANFVEGGFNKVGMHDVMGSPISVDVDDDNLTNSSAMAYYKDLL